MALYILIYIAGFFTPALWAVCFALYHSYLSYKEQKKYAKAYQDYTYEYYHLTSAEKAIFEENKDTYGREFVSEADRWMHKRWCGCLKTNLLSKRE